MKIKLFMLFTLSHELFAFDMMGMMNISNAKKMMLMPLHPEKKIKQGLRLTREMSHLMRYSITEMTQNTSRTIHKEKGQTLTAEFTLY